MHLPLRTKFAWIYKSISVATGCFIYFLCLAVKLLCQMPFLQLIEKWLLFKDRRHLLGSFRTAKGYVLV